MLNAVLLSFFFGMPAIVAVATARNLTFPPARALMFWGGCVAVVLAAMVILPMLACDGSLMTGYDTCLGSAALGETVTGTLPLQVLAGKIYILAGIPLAVFAYAANLVLGRKPGPA
ncbi:hypothetical protein [Roseovarius sp.]|uniref:hypothetical protein n=1 Tax=Roseovarius sp. TaxID=1486281 RepID=UPI003BAA75A3